MKRPTSLRLRQEIASCLKAAIKKGGLSKKEAAELLGVERQTLWLYLTAKVAPGPEVLRKASRLWKLKLSNGYVLKSGAFGPEKNIEAYVKQLNLYEALEQISSDQIEAQPVGRIGEYFEIRVRIKLAS
jgi:transcriptional regulator with XRE-family HTH domain